MKYISTRKDVNSLSAAQAIIAGIAGDGGLFVPDNIPHIEQNFIETLLPLSYPERAKKVLGKFLEDYTEREIDDCVLNAYGKGTFDTKEIAPVVRLDDNMHVLELWHGPTSAFKDMALQLLPQLMKVALKKNGEKAEVVILVATSGDTGKAALEGFKDVDQIRIMVFYPKKGVSKIQQLQMVTQEGSNVAVIAVDGNFDDAQTGVKKIFNDPKFNELMKQKGFKLSSANSINWGRLVPQIVYYFSAYADLIKTGRLRLGDAVNFIVPTGNFGNILAGYYAKEMGLPVNKLICASNTNHVLTDFLHTGIYDKKRSFHKTISPSMDILISSNLERFLYHLSGGDKVQINEWMTQLQSDGAYDVGEVYLHKIKKILWADWADDRGTAKTIREVYQRYGYVVDPHTAVAWRAAEAYKEATGDQTVNVIVSTASPYKFNASVLEALGTSSKDIQDEFQMLEVLKGIGNIPVPEGLSKLKDARVLHQQECLKEDMSKIVITLL